VDGLDSRSIRTLLTNHSICVQEEEEEQQKQGKREQEDFSTGYSRNNDWDA